MNQEAISELYDSIEGLDDLSVFEVRVNRDGPVMVLRADLARFPDHPSKRWHNEANSIQVQVDFIGVEDVQIQGFGVVNQGVLSVQRGNGKYSFSFHGAMSHIRGNCAGLRVVSISAYKNESS